MLVHPLKTLYESKIVMLPYDIDFFNFIAVHPKLTEKSAIILM